MIENKTVVHIVDDDLSIGKALGRLLKSTGYQYDKFTSAEDFLQRADKNATGCLILDIKLPGMDGLELQQELKKQQCNIPIIFITGHGDKLLRDIVMKTGAYGYLEKPFDEKHLINLVKNAKSKCTGIVPDDSQLHSIHGDK